MGDYTVCNYLLPSRKKVIPLPSLHDVQYSQMEEFIILPPPRVGQLGHVAGFHPLKVSGMDPQRGMRSRFLPSSLPLDSVSGWAWWPVQSRAKAKKFPATTDLSLSRTIKGLSHCLRPSDATTSFLKPAYRPGEESPPRAV